MRTETYATPEPIRLGVRIRSGSLQITASQVTETTVEIEGQHADEVVLHHEQGELWIEAPTARGLGSEHEWAIHLRVTTPAHGDITVQSGSASVTVSGVVKAARVKTGSGSVSLDEVESETLVDTGSGRIVLTQGTGDTRLRTGSGGVQVGRLQGEGLIATGSGHVQLGAQSGALSYKAGSGDLRIDELQGELKARTGSGAVMVGRTADSQIDAKTGSGDLTIAIPSGTPLWTDILSGRPVESTLPKVGEPAPGQDFVKVSARTGSGVVRLTPWEDSRMHQGA